MSQYAFNDKEQCTVLKSKKITTQVNKLVSKALQGVGCTYRKRINLADALVAAYNGMAEKLKNSGMEMRRLTPDGNVSVQQVRDLMLAHYVDAKRWDDAARFHGESLVLTHEDVGVFSRVTKIPVWMLNVRTTLPPENLKACNDDSDYPTIVGYPSILDVSFEGPSALGDVENGSQSASFDECTVPPLVLVVMTQEWEATIYGVLEYGCFAPGTDQ